MREIGRNDSSRAVWEVYAALKLHALSLEAPALEELLEEARDLVATHGQEPSLLRYLARVQYARGNLRGAILTLEQALGTGRQETAFHHSRHQTMLKEYRDEF